MVLAGLHSGSAVAHERHTAHSTDFVSHGHSHGSHDGGDQDDDLGESSADFDGDQSHHHCPAAPAPHLPQAEFGGGFGQQMLFAFEVAFLRLGTAAPPLDPPKA